MLKKTLLTAFIILLLTFSNTFAKTVKFELNFNTEKVEIGKVLDLTIKAIDENGNIDKNFTGTVLFIEGYNTWEGEIEFPGFADTTYPAYTFKKSDFGIKKFENAIKFIKVGKKGIAVAIEEEIGETGAIGEKNITVINGNNKCKGEKCNYNTKNIIHINFLQKKITVGKRVDFTIKIMDKNNKIDENFIGEIKINFEADKGNINFYGFENNNSPSYIFTKKDKGIHTFTNSIQYLNTGLKTLGANNPKTLDSGFNSIIEIENISLFMNGKKVSYDDLKLKIIPRKYLSMIVRSLTIAEDKGEINKIGEKIHNLVIKFQKNPIKYKKTLNILHELSYIIGYYGFLLPG